MNDEEIVRDALSNLYYSKDAAEALDRIIAQSKSRLADWRLTLSELDRCSRQYDKWKKIHARQTLMMVDERDAAREALRRVRKVLDFYNGDEIPAIQREALQDALPPFPERPSQHGVDVGHLPTCLRCGQAVEWDEEHQTWRHQGEQER
jgi:hypothetical protein